MKKDVGIGERQFPQRLRQIAVSREAARRRRFVIVASNGGFDGMSVGIMKTASPLIQERSRL
jgi:hypothetical protein